jgi:hypothetical protein
MYSDTDPQRAVGPLVPADELDLIISSLTAIESASVKLCGSGGHTMNRVFTTHRGLVMIVPVAPAVMAAVMWTRVVLACG